MNERATRAVDFEKKLGSLYANIWCVFFLGVITGIGFFFKFRETNQISNNIINHPPAVKNVAAKTVVG